MKDQDLTIKIIEKNENESISVINLYHTKKSGYWGYWGRVILPKNNRIKHRECIEKIYDFFCWWIL